jgi:DoxX
MVTIHADAAMPLWGRSLMLGSALIGFAERWLAPLLFLAIRLWMAESFFRSGLLKIRHPSGAIYLFTEVHPVPFLAPWLATYLVTAIKLVSPCCSRSASPLCRCSRWRSSSSSWSARPIRRSI